MFYGSTGSMVEAERMISSETEFLDKQNNILLLAHVHSYAVSLLVSVHLCSYVIFIFSFPFSELWSHIVTYRLPASFHNGPWKYTLF
ncbi:unnamed protein product [Camellia sinensis]